MSFSSRVWKIVGLPAMIVLGIATSVGSGGGDATGGSGTGAPTVITPSVVFVQVGKSRDFSVDGMPLGPDWHLTMGGTPCAPAVCGQLANATATSVTYEAPLSVPAPSGDVRLSFGATASADITVTTIPVMPRTLTVKQTNPATGVLITVHPLDNNGQGDEKAPMTRRYDDQVNVTLTAAETVFGSPDSTPFAGWSGCDLTSGPRGRMATTCSVLMNADRTVIANYGPMLTSIAPDTGVQGQPPSRIVLNGLNLSEPATIDATTPAGLPATGLLTFTNIAVQGSNQLAADVAIAANAGGGQYNVMVTTPQGTTAPLLFAVGPAATAPSCLQTGTTHKSPTINASERWTAAAGPHQVPFPIVVGNGAVLTIEAGARVCLGHNAVLTFQNGARLIAGASGGATVVFTPQTSGIPWGGISLLGAPVQGSSIIGARVEEAAGTSNGGALSPAIVTSATHTITIRDTLMQKITYTALDIRSPGSTIVQSSVDGTGDVYAFPKVKLSGSGINFASRVRNAIIGVDVESSSVTLSNCEISGNGTGVVVGSDASVTGVSIRGCNLVGNADFAVAANAFSGSSVDATGNWWGTASGPVTTGSNRVVGAGIDATQWLTAPIALTY